jgi:hypothetical protein
MLDERIAESNDDLLDRLERAAFGYFIENVNPRNGLVADTSRPGSPASIAVVGFALSAYPIGVERGWMSRAEASALTVVTLRFFWNSQQREPIDATGYKGFYYHFLDMESGKRVWQSELSLIDTTLLLAGVLTTGEYFSAENDEEAEIRHRAEEIYRRIDWQWALGGATTARQGWKPESGFLHYGWEGYSEAAILYVLGIASPTHPLPSGSFKAWTSTYQWENVYDIEYLYAGPLFIHHFSQAWIDFSGIQDAFMREKGCDYFENTRRATLIQREYARRNPHDYKGYGQDCWGFTAGEGPGFVTRRDGACERDYMGYVARGVPFGPDDGTIDPCAVPASLPFAPDLALAAIRHLLVAYPEIAVNSRLTSGFNPTFPGASKAGWVSPGCFGLDQGIVVLMIENFRSGMIWKLLRQCGYITDGLRKAGFAGGWLS